ncbi:putative ABC transport system ATP-binding protein [Algoriphagus boseongensis]|uniref:Putative ABC transport system ATP-binding protein n=1 Tax=Algoriphagus boseongensis TaxID=1442587 RepID=A0A4R6T301_9BACT|nr:ATP-binding cassette domain-containing protein [Algoriphagus boseongensis]TDQ15138.1 putative ABC transport system ATP-binding protein [Algoriphagus boseongensis]
MLLQTSSLSFSHPGQSPIQFPDIHLNSGDSLLILGKSGSGKTTLLNLLSGLLRPLTGEVILDGKSLSKLSSHELDEFRGKKIGIVFQKPHLISALNVKENLQLVPYFSKEKAQNLDQLLIDLGIGGKAKSSVLTLSEGEAQRVSIARALAVSPKLILADEPTSSLDDEHAEKVIQLLKSQSEKIGAALVIVTHDQRVKNHISNFIEVKA